MITYAIGEAKCIPVGNAYMCVGGWFAASTIWPVGGREVQMGGDTQLTYVAAQWELTQRCKAIILQLKKHDLMTSD